jgi:transposase-like protein
MVRGDTLGTNSSTRFVRHLKTSHEIIGHVVMMNVRDPLSLRNVGGLLRERGIDLTQEKVWFWWNRFGAIFATGNPPQPDPVDTRLPASPQMPQ